MAGCPCEELNLKGPAAGWKECQHVTIEYTRANPQLQMFSWGEEEEEPWGLGMGVELKLDLLFSSAHDISNKNG